MKGASSERARLDAWEDGRYWGTIVATLYGERRTLSQLGEPMLLKPSLRTPKCLLSQVGSFRRRERWGLLLEPVGWEVYFRPVRLSLFPRRVDA